MHQAITIMSYPRTWLTRIPEIRALGQNVNEIMLVNIHHF